MTERWLRIDYAVHRSTVPDEWNVGGDPFDSERGHDSGAPVKKGARYIACHGRRAASPHHPPPLLRASSSPATRHPRLFFLVPRTLNNPNYTMSNVDWDSKVVIGQKGKAAKVTRNTSDLNGASP